MNFYQRTQNWLKGEQFEGTVILVSGIFLIIISVSLIIIDHFSKERAQLYYQHLVNEIQH